MKKVLFAAAIMMAAGAKAQQVNYTISGVSKDNGAKVVVIDAQARKMENAVVSELPGVAATVSSPGCLFTTIRSSSS